MSTDEPTAAEQPWGAQAPAAPQRPRWSGKKTAAAVAIALVIAAGGGPAIWAATANDAGTQQGPGGGQGFGPGGAGPDGMGPGTGLGTLAQALHGEFVVADGSTRLLQNGKVTALSDTSISVTSTDNYAKTYTIDGSTVKRGDIQTGDTVLVIAKEAGTAISIIEPSAMQQGGSRPDRQQQPPTSR